MFLLDFLEDWLFQSLSDLMFGDKYLSMYRKTLIFLILLDSGMVCHFCVDFVLFSNWATQSADSVYYIQQNSWLFLVFFRGLQYKHYWWVVIWHNCKDVCEHWVWLHTHKPVFFIHIHESGHYTGSAQQHCQWTLWRTAGFNIRPDRRYSCRIHRWGGSSGYVVNEYLHFLIYYALCLCKILNPFS